MPHRKLLTLLLLVAGMPLAYAGYVRFGVPAIDHGLAVAPRMDAFHADMVATRPLPERAHFALQLAINQVDGAADYVIANAASWQSGLDARDETLRRLVGVAVDSPRLETRMAAYELSLAAAQLPKDAASVDQLEKRLRNDASNSAAFALWHLGALGSRGIERERIYADLEAASRAGDENTRLWAVNGLAVFGGEATVPVLLEHAAHDPSANVAERAFCALAASGTLHIAERYAAIPGLVDIAAASAPTDPRHGWSFQALREISGMYDVADDVGAWRQRLDEAGLLQRAAVAR